MGGPLRASGRNQFALHDFGGGEALIAGFESFVAVRDYRQRIDRHDGYVLLCILEGEGVS